MLKFIPKKHLIDEGKAFWCYQYILLWLLKNVYGVAINVLLNFLSDSLNEIAFRHSLLYLTIFHIHGIGRRRVMRDGDTVNLP
jgi:hypothetical protein